VTDGNVTCVDHRGRLEVGGDTIDFSTNEVITGQGGTITDLNVDSDGLSLTYIGDGGTTYVDCIVVD